MKNIILIGASRAGKSTFTKLLNERFNIMIIRTDLLRLAFRDAIYKDKTVSLSIVKSNPDYINYVLSYYKYTNMYDVDYMKVVDTVDFEPKDCCNFENSIVTIPNSTISNEALINWSKMKKRRYKQDFVIELSTPLKKVCDVQSKITTMLENHSRVSKEGLVVKFDKVTNSGYNILVRVFTDAISYTDFLNTSENINLNIMDILQKEKVELAYNSQTIYLKK